MTSTELTIRQFNGTDITQRRADGYMDATAMCQANGKFIGHYLANATTKAFLNELSGVIGITITELVQVTQGGDAGKQGTYVHPYIAVNLGQWCSPAFAVKVSQWVIERNEQKPAMSINDIRMFAKDMNKLYGAQASAKMLRNIGVDVPEFETPKLPKPKAKVKKLTKIEEKRAEYARFRQWWDNRQKLSVKYDG